MSSLSDLISKLYATIELVGLTRMANEIVNIAQPAIMVELKQFPESEILIGKSKIGGNPDLPITYQWPEWHGKPMGFVGQFELATATQYDLQCLLPSNGLLSFFYDFCEQPWGYDPKRLGYSRIEYFPSGEFLERRIVPNHDIVLTSSAVHYASMLTIPVVGSQDFEKFEANTKLTEEESDNYCDLPGKLNAVFRSTASESSHRLLGHSTNLQGDMQLEAQLVTNGLYCGNSSGYKSARAKSLKAGASDWQLLFQLDSDNDGEFMWGDSGMLYYWLRKSDLLERKFENHWMTMQCF